MEMSTNVVSGGPEADVVVIGTGNAAFCAAITAREEGASVLMLEKAPEEWAGGNTWFTAGAYRMAHGGLEDLAGLVDPPDGDVELAPYPEAAYEADMLRITDGRCDPQLTRVVVSESRQAAEWLKQQGVRWRLMTERQSHLSGGRRRFWGGLAVGTVGGGIGLVDALRARAADLGISVCFGVAVDEIVREDGAIRGVIGRTAEGRRSFASSAVVVASGGFEASPELRARYLGPDWVHARVRGTPHNTGEPLLAALSVGAQPIGQWDGCHAIAWDAAAPPAGDRSISNRYSRQAYPQGIVVNAEGNRFIDEGADFRNYTYAKYGAEILKQPGGRAFQLFDAKTIGFISPIDYVTATRSRHEATTIGELADLAGIDRQGLEETVSRYNAAVSSGPSDPTVLDGKGTNGIEPPKSNWAQPLDTPPYVAFGVVCGITFTFGGLHVDESAQVLDVDGQPIPGLLAAGEAVGGLFYGNYPGGTGLATGAVLGRHAGRSAARHVAAITGSR
jgi:tricarballylate dehydrogenase